MVALTGTDLEIRRDSLLHRIERVAPRIVALIAPAGFGKTTLARQLIRGKSAALCDAMGIADDLDLARRLLPALALETPALTQSLTQRELMLGDDGTSVAERVNLALEAWKAPTSAATIFVFENAEYIARRPTARDFFARLLTQVPAGRTLVICSRENLRVHLTRFASPHEILTMRAGELAFGRDELAPLFQDYETEPELLTRIMQLSQGWPIAVFLLKRFAKEGRIEQLLNRLGDVAFEELHDYLADQVLASLHPDLVDALFACACLPHAMVADLQLALDKPSAVSDLVEFARESPFLSRTNGGEYLLHPLLASLLVEYRQEQRDRVLERTARAQEERQRFTRAAEIHLARRDQTAAAHALGMHEVIDDHTPSMAYARVLSSLERALVQRYPRLWAVTALLRIFCVDTEELLDEAEALWRTLAPACSTAERYYLLIVRVLFMSSIGLLHEGLEVVQRFAAQNGEGAQPNDRFEAALCYLLGMLRARLGHVEAGERDLTAALPLLSGMDVMACGTLLSLGADVARVRGEHAAARQFVDRALEAARRSGLFNFIAASLAQAAFGAWLSGDDGAFSRYAVELDEVAAQSGVRGFAYFAAVVRGRSQEPCDADLPEWVACGRIIEAANDRDPIAAVRHAKAGLAAARQYGCAFVETLAAVALAYFDEVNFDEHLRAAINVAERCDSRPLVNAVYAIGDRALDFGMLGTFVRRLQREELERVPTLEVRLTSGQVFNAGRVLSLSERALALLTALSLRREIVPRSRLADMLWPELDEYAARNALSVCLHRLRAHLGNDRAVMRTKEGYALGESVRVDLWDIDRAVAALRARTALSDAQRRILLEAYERLRTRRPDRMLQWEWFDPTERHINELRLEVAGRLAKDALSHGEPHRALAFAEEMIGYDACDEGARQIAITAHLAIGDRGAALRQYRQYRDVLAAELQVEPGAEIRQLVGLL